MEVAVAPQVVGRYAIYGKIASGGMASVHFGRLLGGAGFSRTVAIKRLHPHLAEDPEFLSTMIDEARLAARIHHPNVVPTLDVVSSDGELLLVMEYVRGEALSRLIKIESARGRVMPLPITSAIVLGALHGLHAAHEATSDQGAALGIVHRDVSPQNILVGVDGLARVIDFGIAKAAGRLQMTREGTVKGKIAYMAPEQLGGAEVTRSADVYAMGVVLWESLTGRRLFQADSDAALAVKVVNGAKEPPSTYTRVPPSLDALVMRALARAPDRRFATAREMAELLTRIVPPALPTDVGEWCSDAAKELLEKRGLVLSEIESSSGVAPVLPNPAPSTPDPAGQPNRIPTSASKRSELGTRIERSPTATPAPPPPAPESMTLADDAPELLVARRLDGAGASVEPAPKGAPRVNARALLADSPLDDDPATIGSKHSNLSMASYAPPESLPWWSRPQLVGALGGGMVLGLVAAIVVWMAGRPAAPTHTNVASAAVPSASASARPQPAMAQSATAAAVAPSVTPPAATSAPSSTPTKWTTITPAESLPAAAPVTSHPTRGRSHPSMTFEPPSESSPTIPPTPAPAPEPPPRPAPAAAPAPNCNPSFTIDLDGSKHFKPECFPK